MIKVFIADDQILFLSMLERVLNSDSEIEIVGTSSQGNQVFEKIVESKPEIVILDIQMPGESGIEILKKIKMWDRRTKVIMLTTFEDSVSMSAIIKEGAEGYFIKDVKPETLIRGIKCVNDGMVLFQQTAFDLIRSEQQVKGQSKKVICGEFSFDSTDILIMKEIAKGKTNKEIAAVLNYSEGTIKNRVSGIISATGLSDRTNISIFAIKNNLI